MIVPPISRVLERLEAAKPAGQGKWQAECPAHDDRRPSLSISEGKDGRVLLKCWVGCSVEAIVAALGLKLADLFDDDVGRGANPPKPGAHVHTLGCTLEDYAKAKRLPADFLRELGISDYKDQRWSERVLRIPYRERDGADPAVRIRTALRGDDRFLWKKGSKPCLYGLWRLEAGKEIVVVEGESDCHTLWHHGIAAVGLPGADTWKDTRDAEHLADFERIFVIVEPDQGGKAVLDWLSRTGIRDRAWIVELGEHKDPSGLHLADPDRFRERFQAALDSAEPWRVRAAKLEDAERSEVGQRCAELAREPRILDRFAAALRDGGIVGEDRLGRVIYLCATSRLLPKIVSVAVKGPSAAGKSIVAERTLDFFPPSAFYVMTAMSERGLIFIDDDMRHRMLVIFEAAGMEGDMQSYLLRSLLSEGRIRYQTTKKDGGEIVGHLIEMEGPTGLIVTTTAISLHPENETRLLSVTATDTPAQTKAVLRALAEERDDDPGLDEWKALQRWLELGPRKVTVPFAAQLAEAIPPVAVRLRRDFGSLLGLIQAHAILHQRSRKRDGRGRIIASIEDYTVVRGLIADLVSEGVEQTVKPTIRQTVEAVRDLKPEHGASRREVAERLKIDPSAAGRRLASARSSGYLRNMETTRGRPARWTLGDPLPDDLEILPAPESVCTCAHAIPGNALPRFRPERNRPQGGDDPADLDRLRRVAADEQRRIDQVGLLTLPDSLLIAIIRAAADEAQQEQLARRWVRSVRLAEVLAERIREQMASRPCSCASHSEPAEDGRCSRCWGWPGGSAGDESNGAGNVGGEQL